MFLGLKEPLDNVAFSNHFVIPDRDSNALEPAQLVRVPLHNILHGVAQSADWSLSIDRFTQRCPAQAVHLLPY